MVLKGWFFPLRGKCSNVWRHFPLSQGGSAMDIWWVEATDALRYLTMHRTPPTTNYCPVQNVNRAKAETAGLQNWSQHIHLSLHSYIHLHLVLFLPLPLLQFPLQASTSTMSPWEPEYSENVELFPIKHS